VKQYASETVAIALCGTKADLLSDDERARVSARASAIARKAGVLHVQTSAKTGTGVREAFEMLAREVQAAAVRRPSPRALAAARVATKSSWGALGPLEAYWPAKSSCAPPGCCLPLPWQRVEQSPMVSRIVSN